MLNTKTLLDNYLNLIEEIDTINYFGKVNKIVGLLIESIGPNVKIGEVCYIFNEDDSDYIYAEVVGINNENVQLMPLGELKGIGYGSKVVSTNSPIAVPVGRELIGRIIDGLGKPIDNKGKINTNKKYKIDNSPPNPIDRNEINDVLPLGIRCLDGFLTCGKGQRIGIFAGSGVGKSTLLGMIARNAQADVNVIVLVGERGREVNEFIKKDLKEVGLKKSVLVVATSDKPALVRIKSVMLGTSIAEYFRDQGLNVLLLVDSLTRFSMAQREVGLAVGEPPVSRGYTPSVFAVMPKLLERAGNSDKGSITGLYTVLVDGDDMNEPIADAVRGILDGHVILSRDIANKNHYPAIDVLASVSRLMPSIAKPDHLKYANKLRNVLSVYKEAQDLINIGAYKEGSNKDIDEAIKLINDINNYLRQEIDESTSFENSINFLGKICSECEL